MPRPADASTIPDMDTDQKPEPEPHPEPITISDPNIVVHVGDHIVPDHYEDGRYEFRLFDSARAHFATIVTERDDATLAHRIVAIHWVGGRLLPVRPEPFTDRYTEPNSVTYRDPPGVTTYVGDPPIFDVRHTHAHLHPHTDPDDPLRAIYHHKHFHAHPGGRPDAHGYRHLHGPDGDTDAALHDHKHTGRDGDDEPADRPEHYPDGWTEDA